MRIGALPACRGVQPMLLRRRDDFKMIAAGACCASARDQKDRKPAQHTRRSPENGDLSAEQRLGSEMPFVSTGA